jgi:hypothetical protein
MYRFIVFTYSLALVASAVLFAGSPPVALALDNAQDDNDVNPAYPNACAVIGIPADADGPTRSASGVLIHPRVVLTAGHVTDWFATIWDVPPERARVSFSADIFADDAVWLEVEDYCTHPLYNGYEGAEGFGDTHDLGLVILKEEVAGIEPATLPYEGLLDDLKAAELLEFGADHGTQFTVVGYGWGYSFPPPTDLRDERGIRRYGPMICMGLMKSSLHFLLDPDGTVTQNGDSGGPTFLEIDDETSVLVAIVAWGSPIPGVDHRYRVDTPDSLEFIESVLSTLACPE